MVDMAMISGTMTALKSASDLAKLMISSHDAGVIRQKAIELQTQILAAQSNALAAQSDQFTALERIRELEKQIADLNTWDTEKKRYELKIVARGSTCLFVEGRRKKFRTTSLDLYNMLSTGQKVYHAKRRICRAIGGGFSNDEWKCPSCNTEIRTPMFTSPTRASHESEM